MYFVHSFFQRALVDQIVFVTGLYQIDLRMTRGKKNGGSRWTAGCEADNFLQDLFEGQVMFRGRKLTDISPREFPQPIEVFNEFPVFYENHNSAVFRTHWNNEKTARGLSTIGTFFRNDLRRYQRLTFLQTLTFLFKKSFRYGH